ncbi:Uncharacterised protein [Mycobacteroides abscessus subsp. massiliense]|nr:Uncharacterised protein [Mycobacteroides abscessus subsp. massiliense]
MESATTHHEFADQALPLIDQGSHALLLTVQRVGDLFGALEQRAQLVASFGDDSRQCLDVLHGLGDHLGQPVELFTQNAQ